MPSPFLAKIPRTVALALLGLVTFACVPSPAAAQDSTFPLETGYVRLTARLQGLVPDGQSIVMGQVEVDLASGVYLPDVTNPIFSGVNFQIEDGSGQVSNHATDVGRLLYGHDLTLTPGITQVKLFRADFYGGGFLLSPQELNWLDPAGPVNIGVDVLNNSWVLNTAMPILSTQLLRRTDWLADAYDIVVVAGTPNDPTAPIPELISSMYNGITVGVSSGVCSHGPTVFQETDGVTAGRCKPDIVAPLPVVSGATALISSYAALLLDEVHERTALGETSFAKAVKPVVIKSILQTGANKLPGWAKGDPTTTADDEVAPLDWQQGAGQVDIDHSEMILATGCQPPGWINWIGWTYEEAIAPGDTRLYYFVLNEDTAKRFAATLNWHRKIMSTGLAYTIDYAGLPNLQLEFYTFANGALTLLQASRSPIDNLQHINLPTLSNGFYVLRVINAGDLAADYALSWGCLPVMESDIGP
jgi:hypothetical protein